MDIIIATSRSINQDRVYQSQQDKKYKIHTKNIQNITSNKAQPLQNIQDYQSHLRKAKSAAKIFEKTEYDLLRKLENRSLLTRIIKVEPSIKTMRIRSSSKDNILALTSINWGTKKKQNEKIKKENEFLNKRFSAISHANIKDYKKKMQEEIKEYLELKNNIRKIKPARNQQSAKSSRTKSLKKLSMGLNLPLLNGQEKIIQTQLEAKRNQTDEGQKKTSKEGIKQPAQVLNQNSYKTPLQKDKQQPSQQKI